MLNKNKHKIRRGKRRRCSFDENDKFVVYNVYINGYSSKSESFHSIVSSMNPDIITQSETLLKFNKKMFVPGYISYTRNRKGKSGGGVSTSVIKNSADNCLKLSQGDGINEYT